MQPHGSAVTALRSSNEHLHYKQCNYLITNGQLYGPYAWPNAWPNVIAKKLLIGQSQRAQKYIERSQWLIQLQ